MIEEQMQIKFLRFIIDTDGKLPSAFGTQTFDAEITAAWFFDYTPKSDTFIKDTAAALIFEFARAYYQSYAVCPTEEILQSELESRSDLHLKQKQDIDAVLCQVRRTPLIETEYEYIKDVLKRAYLHRKGLSLAQRFTAALETDPEEAVGGLLTNLAALQQRVSSSKRVMDDASLTVGELTKHYLNRIQNEEEVVQGIIPYPYSSWNSALGGMRRGEVSVFAAKKNVGKSFIVHDIAYAAMEQGLKVVCVELEMLYDQIFMRFCARQTGLPSRKIEHYTDQLTSAERSLVEATMFEISNKEQSDLLFIPAHKGRTIDMIRREVAKFFGNDKPDILVVDYLTQMKPSKGNGEGWEAVEGVIQDLKAFAMEYACVVITPIHMNAKGESQYRSVADRCDIMFMVTEDEERPYIAPMDSMGVGTPGILKCFIDRNRNGPKNIELLLEVEFATASVRNHSALGRTNIASAAIRTYQDQPEQ